MLPPGTVALVIVRTALTVRTKEIFVAVRLGTVTSYTWRLEDAPGDACLSWKSPSPGTDRITAAPLSSRGTAGFPSTVMTSFKVIAIRTRIGAPVAADGLLKVKVSKNLTVPRASACSLLGDEPPVVVALAKQRPCNLPRAAIPEYCPRTNPVVPLKVSERTLESRPLPVCWLCTLPESTLDVKLLVRAGVNAMTLPWARTACV